MYQSHNHSLHRNECLCLFNLVLEMDVHVADHYKRSQKISTRYNVQCRVVKTNCCLQKSQSALWFNRLLCWAILPTFFSNEFKITKEGMAKHEEAPTRSSRSNKTNEICMPNYARVNRLWHASRVWFNTTSKSV